MAHNPTFDACIGMFIIAASLFRMLAMTADNFHEFCSNKLWLRTKYFSTNVTSLTLLAVVLTLPVDLNTRTCAPSDRLAKVSSLVYISIAVGNFMTCLGKLDEKKILANVAALGIIVCKIVVNLCIQIIKMRCFLGGRELFWEEIIACGFMLFLLVLLSSTAVMVLTTKRYLESKYHEMLRMASHEESMEERNLLTVDKLRFMIQKYWVMMVTSRPQFVIARSVTCTASGILCLLVAFVLAESEVRMWMKYKHTLYVTASIYGWSIKCMVLVQSIGVGIGMIAPAFQWLTAANFEFHEKGNTKSFRDEFKIDDYWIQRLVEWKEGCFLEQNGNRNSRFLILKRLVLDFAVKVQIFIVLTSKLVRFLSRCFTRPVISFIHHAKKLKFGCSSSQSRAHGILESELNSSQEMDLTRYVILLEGEVELPQKTIADIRKEVDKVIETGKKQKPKNLIKLLQKAGDFRVLSGVHSQEPPKCWSLPLVALKSIAVALPNIPKANVNRLLESMDEGLFYVKLIEKALDEKGNLANSRNAEDVIWVGVELYRQDKDLHKTTLKGKNSKEILQELSMKSEKTILDFKREVGENFGMENPLNWPVNVIAANSVYGICQRLFVACEGNELQMDDGLFEHIIVMIANIIAVCLTNLKPVIILKCHHENIKEAAERVHQATLLLGETEEILKMIQMYRATRLDPDESAFVEEWCNLIEPMV